MLARTLCPWATLSLGFTPCHDTRSALAASATLQRVTAGSIYMLFVALPGAWRGNSNNWGSGKGEGRAAPAMKLHNLLACSD